MRKLLESSLQFAIYLPTATENTVLQIKKVASPAYEVATATPDLIWVTFMGLEIRSDVLKGDLDRGGGRVSLYLFSIKEHALFSELTAAGTGTAFT